MTVTVWRTAADRVRVAGRLGEQARLLQAAEVIHRRAEVIQQWPFQQRRLAQMAGIVGSMVTFVITGLITRLALVRSGL